uniref:Protein krueppel n=1 Tax=Anopheles stephensi TaxID=30069 RepID=A0A182Y973_ANOST
MRAERLKASQTCRFCLSQGVRLSSIYAPPEQNKTTPLALQIMACVGIEVYREDGMPGMICENCRILMNYCYQFKQMCNNADTQLKTFLSTGIWPKQLTLPKELATLLPNSKQSPVRTTKSPGSGTVQLVGVESLIEKEKKINIIKLSPTDLKNIKLGQRINLDNLGLPKTTGKTGTVLSVASEESNDSARMPLMTSTPIPKRVKEIEYVTGNSETSKVAQQDKKQRMKKEQMVQENKTPNGPIILNNLTNAVVPKVEEEFVSTGEGTVEMVVSYETVEPKAPAKPDVFPCPECQKTYPLKQLLDIHLLSHKRERNYPCEECNKRFFSKYDLAKHVATHTGERPYICVICRASFSRSTLLTRHQAKHKDEPKHMCTFCDRSFLSVDELNKHVENHEKNRPFKCELCPKRFAYKQGLERHEVVHKEKLPFQCEYCDQSYLTAGKLSRHLTTHAGDRPYPCRLCNKSFLLSHHLSRHLRRHNAFGQSEYKCVDCKELLNSMGELVYHSAQHAMQNLICPLCREPFESVDSVTEHIKSHADQLHYACDYCDLMYTSEQALNDHCLDCHANELAYEIPENQFTVVIPEEMMQNVPPSASDGKGLEEESTNVAEPAQANNNVMEYDHLMEEEMLDSMYLQDVPSASVGSSQPKQSQATVERTDEKPSRQQRMEEFYKRNEMAVEKKMAHKNVSDVLKNLPKGVTVSKPALSSTASSGSVEQLKAKPEAKLSSEKLNAVAARPSTIIPQKRGPGRPPKLKPEEPAKNVAAEPQAAVKKDGGAQKIAAPKHSLLPTKTTKPVVGSKSELKRSASAIELSKDRPKIVKVVQGQENSTTSGKNPTAKPTSKLPESQSWMIKRTYAPKEPSAVGKKRPAEKSAEESEEVAPSKRPALSRKTLNPSMIRVMDEKGKSDNKPAGFNVGTVGGSTTAATAATAARTATTTTNSINLKRVARSEIMKGTPVEVNIGGKTIKVHKISKEEVVARAAQLKGKS